MSADASAEVDDPERSGGGPPRPEPRSRKRFIATAYSEHDIFAIKLALEEALVNAIKHGNQMDPDKRVLVGYQVTPQRFEIRITDEGQGFNPEDVPDPTAEENIERPCGRGLLLMRGFMTEVDYQARATSSPWPRSAKRHAELVSSREVHNVENLMPRLRIGISAVPSVIRFLPQADNTLSVARESPSTTTFNSANLGRTDDPDDAAVPTTPRPSIRACSCSSATATSTNSSRTTPNSAPACSASRSPSATARFPMAGVPVHRLEHYLGLLLRAGHRVAVCEQMEEPTRQKRIIHREVNRIVTPGTVTEDDLLDPRAPNHLVAVVPGKGLTFGLAWVDLSTGSLRGGRCAASRSCATNSTG